MKLRTARALDGYVWMRSGLRHLARQPLGLSALFGMMLFGLLLTMLVPWFGPLIASALLPALGAGWVHTIERVQAGERPMPAMLLEPLKSDRRIPLLHLGGWHALAVVLTISLAQWVLPDPASQASGSAGSADAAEVIHLFSRDMLVRQAFLIPVALAFWHAPVLVHRAGSDVAKAVFASTVASLRNLPAFVVFGLCWMVLSGLAGGLLALVNVPAVVLLVAVPLGMAITTAFYASLHATVHGCIDFEDDARDARGEMGEAPADPPVGSA